MSSDSPSTGRPERVGADPDADAAAILQAVDACFERALTELIAYLRIPSLSQEGRGMQEGVQFLAALMQRCGVASRILPTSGFPVVYGDTADGPVSASVNAPVNALVGDRVGDGADEREEAAVSRRGAAVPLPTVLIYGHYDVQVPGPEGAWTSPPFEPSVREGRLFARGAGDNKGQHLAHLMALAALRDAGLSPPLRLKFLIEGEEEIGSPNLECFVVAHRELLRADVLFAADGPMHPSGRPTIYLGARGLVKLRLRARGAAHDAHSGNFGGLLPNPAQRLLTCLASLFDRDGRPAIDGFWDAVRTPDAEETARLAGLPFDAAALAEQLGLDAAQLGDPRTAMRRLLYEPLVNVHSLRAGSGASVIPAEASAGLDVRLVPDQRAETVVEQLRAHLTSRGFDDVELEAAPARRNPSRTSRQHPCVEAVCGALRLAYGAEPLVLPNLGAALPCDVFTEHLGLPGVWVAYANHDERNHAPDENLGLRELRCAMRASALAWYALARQAGSEPQG